MPWAPATNVAAPNQQGREDAYESEDEVNDDDRERFDLDMLNNPVMSDENIEGYDTPLHRLLNPDICA